ncbi:MAG: ISAs1 family transposase [Desulfobacterales bacterium]|nr:ISAs1 family transposase [Desulfobacterales bacterium]
MKDSAHALLLRIFRDMPDQRMPGKVIHKLHDILVITVCAVICGLEHWTQIEDFTNANEQWFREFLELPNGVPSHDTFGKVFSVINPDEFERRIQKWIHCLVGSNTQQKHIAIDGKTLRKSFDTASGKAAIHMLNAYVYENHAVFGQLKVDSKTNEITAIPKLLEMLQLKDATVTIDAMGCQKNIAQKIIENQGHYVLALKGNQGALKDDVELFMNDRIAEGSHASCDYYETVEKSHGRIEIRKCWTCWDVNWLNQRHQWMGLSCIAAVESTRTINGKSSTERRYFISSHSGRQAQKIAVLVRNHWRVENELHWTLDVSFNEDQCRVRIENAAENLARIRRIALLLLKNDKTCKLGTKSKRAKAGYDRSYLLTLLGLGADKDENE